LTFHRLKPYLLEAQRCPFATALSINKLRERKLQKSRRKNPDKASIILLSAFHSRGTLCGRPFALLLNVFPAIADDNKFVDCAIVANADFIVSEDNHFNILKEIPFPHIRVIKLEDFAAMYKSN